MAKFHKIWHTADNSDNVESNISSSSDCIQPLFTFQVLNPIILRFSLTTFNASHKSPEYEEGIKEYIQPHTALLALNGPIIA